MTGSADDHQMLWMEEEDEEDMGGAGSPSTGTPAPSGGTGGPLDEGAMRQLEAELARTREELMAVRKDLAAKTVQLSRKEQIVVQEKAAELAASVTGEKDLQLQQLMEKLQGAEMALAQREEELEESRRLYTAQKRALREAVNAVAEKEAVERALDEASHTAASAAFEDEVERLQHELQLTKTRAGLELKARDSQMLALKQLVNEANESRQAAVARAEQALTEAWQVEVDRVQAEAEAQLSRLETEVLRLRTQMEDERRQADSVSLSSELAALNNNKVQIQREFEAFKDLATAAARQKREEMVALLEENAMLKSKLAAKAVEQYMAASGQGAAAAGGGGIFGGGVKGLSKIFDAATPAGAAPSDRTFLGMLSRLERQRKGLVPGLVVGTLLLLIMVVAVVRATASAHEQHRGALCVLAKLGIRIGKGCNVQQDVAQAATHDLAALLDTAPRVHDVDVGVVEGAQVAGVTAGTQVSAASFAAAITGGSSSSSSSTDSRAGEPGPAQRPAADTAGGTGGGTGDAGSTVGGTGGVIDPTAVPEGSSAAGAADTVQQAAGQTGGAGGASASGEAAATGQEQAAMTESQVTVAGSQAAAGAASDAAAADVKVGIRRMLSVQAMQAAASAG